MDWLPIVVGAITGLAASSPSWGPVLYRLLLGRYAARSAGWERDRSAYQETIDHLRSQLVSERDRWEARIDALETHVVECEKELAVVRQRLTDLEGPKP